MYNTYHRGITDDQTGIREIQVASNATNFHFRFLREFLKMHPLKFLLFYQFGSSSRRRRKEKSDKKKKKSCVRGVPKKEGILRDRSCQRALSSFFLSFFSISFSGMRPPCTGWCMCIVTGHRAWTRAWWRVCVHTGAEGCVDGSPPPSSSDPPPPCGPIYFPEGLPLSPLSFLSRLRQLVSAQTWVCSRFSSFEFPCRMIARQHLTAFAFLSRRFFTVVWKSASCRRDCGYWRYKLFSAVSKEFVHTTLFVDHVDWSMVNAGNAGIGSR